MATVSIRGLDEKVIARLKRQAHREVSRLNSLVVRMLQGDSATKMAAQTQKIFDDLDALAGTWSSQQVTSFGHDTAASREVDPMLWK